VFAATPRTSQELITERCRFVLAHLVQLAIALDAIIAKNTIQVVRLLRSIYARPQRSLLTLELSQVALILFNTLFLVYAIIQVRWHV
jgi:hypothetical protein